MKLLHGDCLDLLPQIPDGSVSLVFADLPYAHVSGGKVRKCTDNAWDTPIDLVKMWAELLRVGKRNAAFVFTATFDFAVELRNSQPKMRCYEMPWWKHRAANFATTKYMPLRVHETVLVFHVARGTYNPQMTQGKPTLRVKGGRSRASHMNFTHKHGTVTGSADGMRHPTTLLDFSLGRPQDSLHPTQKPVALLEWLVKTYTNPGEVVLDPTAGSFTTGVACVRTGRDFIGIEKDADYFQAGQQRVLDAQQGAA